MSELFIKRPVMTTLVMVGLFLFGVVAYRGLPVSDLPNVDFPTIQVSAALPGASPDTMASSVATPLERQFTTIAGLDSMTSASAQGVTAITLQFNLSRNIDNAAQDVQSAIAVAARQLPPNLPTPPSYQKVNPADQPFLYLALTSATLPLSELDEYGETMLAQRISTISGVAQVIVYGSQKYAVRLQVDPKALATRGIGLDEVASAVGAQNVNLPTGTLYGPNTAYTVQANGQLTEAKSYRNLIVAYRNGNPVRMEQLGRVIDSVENDKTAAWFIDQRSVVLAIQRQPGVNTVEVAGAVMQLVPKVEAQLPASVSLHVLFDRSESIKASVQDVKFTLALTLALVVLVIFLFLRNVRATVIPSMALPMSLVGTFIVLYLLGYQLDNLSLMAVTLSVGFVVDDAIVMLENIVRHVEKGEGVLAASLRGSREIGFTILSMTISLAAVFIPVLFMGGIVGRLFHEFAIAIGASILVSGFVSLSLTPMLCSRFLKPHGEVHHGRLYQISERGFEGMLHAYQAGLKWSLNNRVLVMIFSGLILIAMVPLFMVVPKGFLPNEDVGLLVAFTESAQGISFPALVKNQQQLAAIVQKDPNVQAFMSSAGARGATGANQGIIFMHLKPRNERALSADEIIEELRPKLSGVPGMRAYLSVPPPIRIGGQLTRASYQYTLQDADTKELYRVAPALEQKMRALPGLQDVNSDLQLKNPQVEVNIDRDKAASLGVTPAAVEDALYTAYGSRQISTIYAPTNEYQVIMELLPEYQADPSAMQFVYVRSASGALVPLSAVASLTTDLGPLTITHSGQLPSVTLSFNLKPGTSIGDAVTEVNKLALQTLPATVATSFQGTAQAFQSSLQGLGMLLVLAILVIYLVLGILYESFIHPLTILSALPFAGFGALVTLLLFRTELSIYAFVGVIMLVGLVKKNGIMMIDFALEVQRENPGKTAAESIYEACVVRFRPIMMTTFAALMGTLPIAMGFGSGAESRRPLGLAVVGGLVFSQMLTLFVTPVFYTYMETLSEKLGRRRVAAASPASPA
jgi:HAE1 family hydrophobic/amphiphilic exporter-1